MSHDACQPLWCNAYRISVNQTYALGRVFVPRLCHSGQKKKSKYGIRSYELEHLHIPDSETKTYGDRAFCFSGPREWNKLSLEIRQSKSVVVFKTKLKTLLFKEYYNSVLHS